ncbi:MAG TPA: hypothetical protein VFW19_05810 [Allosphingosinicella sp.]|nr:hypothetical protein [Allosphingosinicella sp.]
MRIRFAAAALLIALPATAAQAMDVATFLAKVDALQKKGMLALLSSDYRDVKTESEAAIREIAAEGRAAKAARKPPLACPPGGKAQTDSNEVIAYFRAMPPDRRARTQVKDALLALLVRKYPCRR